jgi:transketolase
MASVKPLDSDLVVECAKQIPHLVTVEDHNIIGGLGSAVAETLCENYPAKLLRIGMEGFGESGKVDDLFSKYRMDGVGIAEQVTAWMGEKD